MRRFKTILEYDGTRFAGWQFQGEPRTVQGELEKALAQMTQESFRVRAASRTDAGVHARGQVVAFDTEKDRISPYNFERGLNTLLPSDVAVRSVSEVAADWDPKLTSRGKRYRYTIWNDPLPTALDRERTWWIRPPLSIEAMAAAGTAFVGTHDFEAFRSTGCEARHAVRTIYEVTIARGERSTIRIDIVGNAFCKNMVRIMVGTLREIGEGRAIDLAAILASRDRTFAGMTAPAEGLCLEEVIYDDRLPPRPRSTRSGDPDEDEE